MKTKAILATLLVAAAASADARFAWPYPRKAVSPDEIGHWVVINGNAWADSSESELTTRNTRRGDASLFGGERTGPAKNRRQIRKNSAPRGRDFTFCEMPIFECLRYIA